MQVIKLNRLQKKIERTKEKLKSIEGVLSVLSPSVYVWETEDIIHAERQYYRLMNRLESYKNKFLAIQNAS